jgi:hypothetical protein
VRPRRRARLPLPAGGDARAAPWLVAQFPAPLRAGRLAPGALLGTCRSLPLAVGCLPAGRVVAGRAVPRAPGALRRWLLLFRACPAGGSIGAPCRWGPGPSGVVLPVGGRAPVGSGVQCGPTSSCVRGPRVCQVQVERSGGHFLFSVPPGTEFSKRHPPSATRSSQGDAGPHPTEEPHRRPPTPGHDNARRPRPPTGRGRLGVPPRRSSGGAPNRRASPEEQKPTPQGTRGAGNCAPSHHATGGRPTDREGQGPAGPEQRARRKGTSPKGRGELRDQPHRNPRIATGGKGQAGPPPG